MKFEFGVQSYPDDNVSIVFNASRYVQVVNMYAKQKHLGCKNMRGQSEATLLTGMCDQKTLISAEAKKLLYQFSTP